MIGQVHLALDMHAAEGGALGDGPHHVIAAVGGNHGQVFGGAPKVHGRVFIDQNPVRMQIAGNGDVVGHLSQPQSPGCNSPH